MREPWDQLATETDESYSHFLIYRNLGVSRSMRLAYKRYLEMYDGYTGSHKTLHIPGNWRQDQTNHWWSERASSWDIRNLHTYGARLAVLHVQSITKIAEKCVRQSKKLNPGDKGWSDLLDSMAVVQSYLTPDVVRGIAERNKIESAGPAPQLAAHNGDGIT